jgi:hypothetical protein
VSLRAPVWLLVIVLGAAGGTAAEDDVYATSEESPITLRGLVDVRVGQGTEARAWTTRGPGKTRFGGERDGTGFARATRVTLAQAILELGGSLPWRLVPRVELLLESDADVEWRPLLVEANVRREWGTRTHGLGVAAGLMPPVFSPEHTGPAWTPRYTLTPWAGGSWVWEELRTTGIEGDVWHSLPAGLRLSVLGGFGWGTDELGALLAHRGWVLSDYLSGVNAVLPLGNVDPESETSVFSEQDGIPAVYVWSTLADERNRASLHVGYLDTLADPDRGEALWATRFGTVALVAHPVARVDVVVQWLEGETRTGTNDWDSRFRSIAPLVSVHHRGHRLTARYDHFSVDDRDAPVPRSDEEGDAVTLAYLFEFRLRHRVGAEWIHVDSDRPGSRHGDRVDDVWQVSYRFRY